MKISTYMLRYKYNNRANSTLNVLNYSKCYISGEKFPRDAMIARYMLSLCVCLSVRLS